MNSRTNFRLQLQREQAIQEQKRTQPSSFMNNNTSLSLNSSISSNVEMADEAASNLSSRLTSPTTSNRGIASSPMAIKVSTNSGVSGNNSANSNTAIQAPKTLPVIISQPIRFAGNRLVHLPPQIIHVQQQTHNLDDMGRKNVTLSSSLPPGLIQSSLARTPKAEYTNHVGTPQQVFFPQQVLSGSKQSSAELSPAGYADSPTASFASAQSELDDVIIDEILSMEEEQQRRKQLRTMSHHQATSPDKLANSLSYTDDLEGLLNADRSGSISAGSSYQRQVSNSAPTTTVDIEGLVRDELVREQEVMRDRRKKDVHNMIERRRRYNINDRIKELGTLLPKSCTEEMKLNKGTILQASVEYILALRKDQDRYFQLQHKQQILETENRRMVQRIQNLEEKLRETGSEVPPDDDKKSVLLLSNDRVIKTEPVEDAEIIMQQQQQQQSLNTNYDPQSSYQQHNVSAAGQQQVGSAEYNPVLSGHSYAISSPSGEQQVQQLQFFNYDNNTAMMNGNAVLLDNRNVPTSNNGGIQLVPVTLLQQQQQQHRQPHNTQQHMQDIIMELGGECNESHMGLMSTADPMMSDTRLLNSHLSSPDINWDSATFSPDNEHMDFVSSS